jgi:putative lipase involved disintegration of autophagic bodies
LDSILVACEFYPGFKVFVTGHSLGGALGLLLSFCIAADPRIPKLVTCVSAGSLLVGDAKFQGAFE